MAVTVTKQRGATDKAWRRSVETDLQTICDYLNRVWSTAFGDTNTLDLATAVKNRLVPASGGTGGLTILQDSADPIRLTPTGGTVFYLEAVGNRTILPIAVTGVPDGQRILIRQKAIGGANRILTLTTGAGVGSFRFGTVLTVLAATVAGTTDSIECVYNSVTSTWDVLTQIQGFA